VAIVANDSATLSLTFTVLAAAIALILRHTAHKLHARTLARLLVGMLAATSGATVLPAAALLLRVWLSSIVSRDLLSVGESTRAVAAASPLEMALVASSGVNCALVVCFVLYRHERAVVELHESDRRDRASARGASLV
jgi:hypothetical protein